MLLSLYSVLYLSLTRFPGGSDGKASACNAGDLGWEDPLEKEMAVHSSTLAWKIPWTEEPDRLQSMGSQRVRHDWVTSLYLSLWPLQNKVFYLMWILWPQLSCHFCLHEINIFFYPFSFRLCVSFALKQASYRQHIVGSCFFLIQPVILCVLIGAFSPLTFMVITDQYVFITILNLVFPFILYFFLVVFFLFFLLWFDDFLFYYVCA